MSTILYPSPIFGPVKSRRLGISLGINLIPTDGKLCTFDCIYCECGLNAERRTQSARPSREAVKSALETQLQKMQTEGEGLDVLTFAGNGEPTAHPDFPSIIEDTIALRDLYFPKAKIAVLSNATFAHRPEVRDALLKVDDNIQKLDTICPDYISRVDRPQGKYDVEKVIEALCAFKGKVIIQTLFMKGEHEGKSVDNTSDEFVLPWLSALRLIEPQSVMVYTIARETPVSGLQKATPEELNAIVARLKAEGISASASY